MSTASRFVVSLALAAAACSAFAEEKKDVSALIEQILEIIDSGEFEPAIPLIQEAAEAGLEPDDEAHVGLPELLAVIGSGDRGDS